jgi:hypothetical protein
MNSVPGIQESISLLLPNIWAQTSTMENQSTATSVFQISTMQRTFSQLFIGQSKNNRYVLGSSSTLFNQILLNLPSGNASTAQTFVENVLQAFNRSEEDIAPYPNPFKAINGSSNTVSTFPNLTLVDGVRPPVYLYDLTMYRAKISRTFLCGHCYRKNEMWISFLELILVPILRIGLMERLMWLLMRNSCLMLRAMCPSLISLINKRISPYI